MLSIVNSHKLWGELALCYTVNIFIYNKVIFMMAGRLSSSNSD